MYGQNWQCNDYQYKKTDKVPNVGTVLTSSGRVVGVL